MTSDYTDDCFKQGINWITYVVFGYKRNTSASDPCIKSIECGERLGSYTNNTKVLIAAMQSNLANVKSSKIEALVDCENLFQ